MRRCCSLITHLIKASHIQKSGYKRSSLRSTMTHYSLHHRRGRHLCFVSNTRPVTYFENIMKKLHVEMKKKQIIKTALRHLCNDIATIDLDPKSYPSVHSMTDIPSQLALVPESLRMFLKPILKTDERVAIWGKTS